MGNYYMISDAAKKVSVEAHVLRYWEEELNMPIRRNELGHRFYTEEDIHTFQKIKGLKEQGLQLKAIRMILKDGKLQSFTTISNLSKTKEEKVVSENKALSIYKNENRVEEGKDTDKSDKIVRLQQLLQQMITSAVAEGSKDLCMDIKESLLKEMDYQFRLQEEREETREGERISREEEHFKKFDELLRNHSNKSSSSRKLFERKKHSI